METLMGVDEGCWVVETSSGSTYEVDLDNWTLIRRPPRRATEPLTLRRDGDALRLLGLVALTVGTPAILVVDLTLAGVLSTTRLTSTVVSITRVGSGLGHPWLIAEFDDVIGRWEEEEETPSGGGDVVDAGPCACLQLPSGDGEPSAPATSDARVTGRSTRHPEKGTPMPNINPEGVTELTGAEGGVWRVRTVGSTHVFDLDAMTVTRIPGATSAPSVNDQTRPIRSIGSCRVGERGRWTMHTDGWSDSVEYYWHVTSTILEIENFVSDADVIRNSPAGD